MIFVIGGINTDISGKPDGAILLHDSNIAKVTVSIGGVGRNIACNLARLGRDVEMIGPLGDDVFMSAVLQDCQKNNIGLNYATRIPGHRSGIYLCINDQRGDMYIAMNDMELCDHLTPDIIDIDAVNSGELCVIDANIPEETLLYIAENVKIPIICDPVSVAKCSRIKPILPYLSAIKPNLIEAKSLTGEDSAERAAMALVDAGVTQAFVSLGRDGICYADMGGYGFCRLEAQSPITSTTGAGDAATAAVCIGFLQKDSTEKTAINACRQALRVITENK